jgi:hypothetical protein
MQRALADRGIPPRAGKTPQTARRPCAAQVFATTEGGDEQGAEAVAQPRALGLTHVEATVAALATTQYPLGAARPLGRNAKGFSGHAAQVAAAAFRTVAVSATDQGALSAAASDAMPLSWPKPSKGRRFRQPGTSWGTTLKLMEPFSIPGANPRSAHPRGLCARGLWET